MKANNILSITPSLALKIITNDYQKEHDELCTRIQYAIDHQASVILVEGEGDTCDVYDTTMNEVYHSFDKSNPEYVGEFEGWSDFKRIIALYFDRATDSVRDDLLASYFTPIILEQFHSPENTNWFDGPEAMAVRVEINDGSWYEHIISWTKPQVKKGRAAKK